MPATIPMHPPRQHPHFRERQIQRQLRTEVLEFILAYGTETHARGATHLTVVARDLPLALRDSHLAEKARGWVVLLDKEGRLRTCYRRPDAVHYIRRKGKHRNSRVELERRGMVGCSSKDANR